MILTKIKKHPKFRVFMNNWKIIGVYFVLLSIAIILSILRWRRDYLAFDGEYCPDRYCLFADEWHNLFTNMTSESYKDMYTFMITSWIASSPLAPMLVGILTVFSNNTVISYVVISAILSLGSVGIFIKMIRSFLQKKFTIETHLIIFLFVFHILMIRAFARPITDSIGLFFTLLALYIVYDISEKFSGEKLAIGSFVIFISLFSRVSVYPVIIFIILWFLIEYLVYKKGKSLIQVIYLSVAPTIGYIVASASLDLIPTIFKALEISQKSAFSQFHTFTNFIKMSFVSLQFYPVIILTCIKKTFSRFNLFHSLWVLVYLIFLLSGEGAFWNRYMLPIVPSVLIISYTPLTELYKKYPVIFYIFYTIVLLLNIVPLSIQLASLERPFFVSISQLFY